MDEYNMKIELFNSQGYQNFRIVIGVEGFNVKVEKSNRSTEKSSILPSQTPFGFKYKASSLRRTKRDLFKLIRHNFNKDFKQLTLTYKWGHTNRKKVYKDIENCAVRYKQVFSHTFKYIAVLEYHKTGHGLHAHLILDVPFFDIHDFMKKVWKQGYCWVNQASRQGVLSGSRSLSSYILKYIEKDFEVLKARQRRYTKSQSWDTSWVTRYFQESSFVNKTNKLELFLEKRNVFHNFFKHHVADPQYIYIYDIYPNEKNNRHWHDFFVSFMSESNRVFKI